MKTALQLHFIQMLIMHPTFSKTDIRNKVMNRLSNIKQTMLWQMSLLHKYTFVYRQEFIICQAHLSEHYIFFHIY